VANLLKPGIEISANNSRSIQRLQGDGRNNAAAAEENHNSHQARTDCPKRRLGRVSG
jgi:hypothetical protein